MGDTSNTERNTRPWWKSGWLAGLVLLGVLHFTGLLVPLQATLQRGLLATGIFRPSVEAVEHRLPADGSLEFVDAAGSLGSTAEMEGDVIFVNVWATWCPPCLAEMPGIDALYREYGDRVRFVMLSVDDRLDTATEFMERKGYALQAVAPAARLPAWLSASVVPRTVVLDRSGRIATQHQGMAQYTADSFRNSLDALVQESK